MRNSIYFVLAIGMIALTSCQKENVYPTSTGPHPTQQPGHNGGYIPPNGGMPSKLWVNATPTSQHNIPLVDAAGDIFCWADCVGSPEAGKFYQFLLKHDYITDGPVVVYPKFEDHSTTNGPPRAHIH